MPITRFVPVIVLCSALAALPRAQTPAPLDDAAMEAFLLTAKVVSTRPIGKGVTGATRATLTDGVQTHDAQIQTVDEFKPVYRTRSGEERNFRDSWRFNVAAYKIDRMLGLHLVPVSVPRRWRLAEGAFTWWVKDVLMDEEGRRKNNTQPPDGARWNSQMLAIRVFDQLIDNVDRNQGNILITNTWRLWAIDHTRAFRYSKTPRKPANVTAPDPAVLERLKALEFNALKKELGRYLTDEDLRNLLARRDAILRQLGTLRSANLGRLPIADGRKSGQEATTPSRPEASRTPSVQ
jgi:hypothetical protein